MKTNTSDPPRSDSTRAAAATERRPAEKMQHICDRCGAKMHERACKVVCSNCGNRFDCSDLTIYFD